MCIRSTYHPRPHARLATPHGAKTRYPGHTRSSATMRDRHRTRPAPRTPVRRKLAAPKTTPKGWLPKARRTCSNGTPKKLLQRMVKAAGIVANEEARRQYQESVALAAQVTELGTETTIRDKKMNILFDAAAELELLAATAKGGGLFRAARGPPKRESLQAQEEAVAIRTPWRRSWNSRALSASQVSRHVAFEQRRVQTNVTLPYPLTSYL